MTLEAPITQDRRYPELLAAVTRQGPDRWTLDGWDLALRLPSATLHLKRHPSGLVSLTVTPAALGHPSLVMYSTEYPQVDALWTLIEPHRQRLARRRRQVLDDLLADLDALG